MQVRSNIFKIRNDVKTHFPERFENEVFHSEGKSSKGSDPVNYISNFSIKYVVNGVENYIVNGKRKKVTSNHMLLINNQSDASFIFANAEALSIFINPEILNDCHCGLITEDKYLEDPFSNVNQAIQFYDHVQKIDEKTKYYINRVLFNNKAILNLDFYYELATILILSQNNLQKTINKVSNKKLSTRIETFRRLELGKDFIDNNLKSPFSLDDVSKVSCLSKYHFIRLFREVYGNTPHRYYLLAKMKLIKDEISSTKEKNSINALAMDYGFSNYSVFYKQFQQIYGIAPSDVG